MYMDESGSKRVKVKVRGVGKKERYRERIEEKRKKKTKKYCNYLINKRGISFISDVALDMNKFSFSRIV